MRYSKEALARKQYAQELRHALQRDSVFNREYATVEAEGRGGLKLIIADVNLSTLNIADIEFQAMQKGFRALSIHSFFS